MDENIPVKINMWQPSEEQLADMTSLKARDLLVECFFTAQLEAFKCVKKAHGESLDEENVRASVVQGIQHGFKETGNDYDEPSKMALVQVVEFLAKMAPVWGTPDDIVEHHREIMMDILERI